MNVFSQRNAATGMSRIVIKRGLDSESDSESEGGESKKKKKKRAKTEEEEKPQPAAAKDAGYRDEASQACCALVAQFRTL